MNEMTEKFKCAECGKEVEFDGGLAVWASKNPDKVRCEECRNKKFAKKSGTAASTKKEFKSRDAQAPAKKPIDAAMFRKAYDELRAEFADELDSVKEYLGGWTSTLVINRSK